MNSKEMLEIIKQRGYYEITLRPNSQEYNFSFEQLEKFVEKNQVRHRGLFYPHIADHKFGKYQRIGKYIESFHRWGTHVDIWRFFKSGQFKEYLGFVEDRWNDHPPLGMQWTEEMESEMPQETFLEPIMTISQLTEIFLFASRIATEIPDNWSIMINLHNMEERKLQIRVSGRTGLYGDYTCHTNTVELTPIEISSDDLKISHDDLAVQKTLEIFDYFKWNAPHLESLLKDEQKRFYSHNF